MTVLTRARADGILLIVAAIWGAAFVAQKAGNEHIGPLSYVFLRFSLAAALLYPCYWWERKRSPVALTRADRIAAVQIGLALCVGSVMQQLAMITTSAGNAGFLTSVYIVIVPFATWVFSGPRPRPIVVLASLVGFGGAWMMAGGSLSGWSTGDIVLLASDLVWASHIVLIGHHRNLTLRPFTLAFVQCGLTAVLSAVPALTLEPWHWSGVLAAATSLLYAGVLSSVVSYTLQIVAQGHTPPAEAALIMSLESVFAALTGAWLLGERMTATEMLGAALIFTSVILVEFGPVVWRRRSGAVSD
jgi:drug/metabolite transporter (DMT)-like permease